MFASAARLENLRSIVLWVRIVKCIEYYVATCGRLIVDTPTIAEPSARVLARLTDASIWFVIWVLTATTVSALASFAPSLEPRRLFVTNTLVLGFIAFYETGCIHRFAVTPGKRALRIRVETVDGLAPTIAAAGARILSVVLLVALSSVPVLRVAALLILGAVTIASFPMMLIDPFRRTVWDRAAKTVVVHDS